MFIGIHGIQIILLVTSPSPIHKACGYIKGLFFIYHGQAGPELLTGQDKSMLYIYRSGVFSIYCISRTNTTKFKIMPEI